MHRMYTPDMPIVVGDVGVIAYGGTHARRAVNTTDGTIENLPDVDTPQDRDGFVNWLAEQTLKMHRVDAVHDIVVTFPGPTHKVGKRTVIGPTVNIKFLDKDTMVLEEELASGELGDLLNANKVTVLAGNDGLEHAAAGAFLAVEGTLLFGEQPKGEVDAKTDYYHTVSSLAIGTGIGGDTVQLVPNKFFQRRAGDGNLVPVYRPLGSLNEWGHLVAGGEHNPGNNPDIDYETLYASPALNANTDFGQTAFEATGNKDAPIWRFAGRGYGDLIGIVALTDNPDLLVIAGGFGSREHDNFAPHMHDRIGELIASRNINLRMALQAMNVAKVSIAQADTSELYGAPVLIAAHKLELAS